MRFQGITARPRRGAARARAWLVAAAVLVVTLYASFGVLPAASAAKNPSAHLTASEARAVRIASVSAVGDDSLGLIVSVRFQGDVARYLGQGNLGQGMLALVLAPGSGSQPPNGVVDEGGGFTQLPVPVLVRRGRRITVKHSVVDAFAPERVLRIPAPGQQTVFRDGNQVIFYLPGVGLAQPTDVKVKIFAKNPAASGRTGPQPVTASGWRKILQTRPTAVALTSVTPTQLTVAQLDTVQSQLDGVLAAGFEPQLAGEQRAQSALKKAIRDYAQNIRRLHVSRSGLAAELRESAAGIARVKAKIAALNKVIARVDALIAATEAPPVAVVQTDPGLSQELAAQPGLVSTPIKPQGVPVINVDDGVRYQRFAGLGAALPDSSAWLIYDNLPPSTRTALMQALFGSPGSQNALGAPAIHLNSLRVPIGAGGAMTVGSPYSYDDNPPGGSDPNLAFFSTTHDEPYIVPTIQQALSINPSLQILANPWSPPAWMKSNDSLDNSGAQGTLLPSDYGPLASYFVKFIQAYAAYGIPIDAITPQNEPSSGQFSTGYPGMTLPEPDEAQFIAQNLEPALRAAGLSPKIYGNDLSWDSSAYADALAADPGARPDLAGIAWHCYYGSPTVMSQLHQTSPGLDQIVSECSPEIRAFGTAEFLISALRNWASTVSVWSAALDPDGGPVQANNNCGGCRGLVTIDEQTQAVTFRPEYYQLGQVSTFVQPGAIRIGSQSFVSYGTTSGNVETVTPGVDDVAFLNPDGSKVLVAYNNSGARTTFGVDWHGSYFTYTLPARALTTFVWR